MATTCCCLGTASVCISSLVEVSSLVALLRFSVVFSDVVFDLTCTVSSGAERDRCEASHSVKSARPCWCVGCYIVWQTSVFGELCPTAGCQTYIHFFCPVSEAISSPYVTVNAYRDTAPCLGLQIYAVEEEEAICLLVMSYKLGSYFTPAGICSSHPQGSS